jgi:hypothetical protein
VNPYRIIAVFVLTIASFLAIIIRSAQSGQAYTVLKKSDFLSSSGKSGFIQKESKYLYVGSEKCASICHNNEEMGFQYNLWKKSPHSEAYIILSSKRAERYGKIAGIKGNPQENSVCLKCHVTGGGLDTSFFAVTYKKDDGVTCESCHKGEYVATTFLPKEKECLKCHNNSVHKTHKFDFNERCTTIVHPRPKANPKGG